MPWEFLFLSLTSAYPIPSAVPAPGGCPTNTGLAEQLAKQQLILSKKRIFRISCRKNYYFALPVMKVSVGAWGAGIPQSCFSGNMVSERKG